MSHEEIHIKNTTNCGHPFIYLFIHLSIYLLEHPVPTNILALILLVYLTLISSQFSILYLIYQPF